MNQQQMATGTPCELQAINPECKYCTYNASGIPKRHFVEIKLKQTVTNAF